MSKDSSKNIINDTIQNNKEIIKEIEEGIKLEKMIQEEKVIFKKMLL